MELKKKAMMAHPSQLGEDILPFVDEMARGAAAGSGLEFAEVFRRFVLEEDPVHE